MTSVVFVSPQQKHTFLRSLRAHQAAISLATDPSGLVEPNGSVPPLLRKLVDAVKLDVAVFYDSIPVGGDVKQVRDKWFLWLLRTELKPHDKKGHCEAVAKLYERRLRGDAPKKGEWETDADAADAAYAAADAADAADAAAYAAYAAYAAADAAAYAWKQKREECYQRCRDELVRLLRTSATTTRATQTPHELACA